MKKFAFAALAVMVMGLFGFAGCKLPDEVVEVTTDKWCKKEATLTAKDGQKYGVTAYVIWASKEDTKKNLSEGLNIVFTGDGPSAALFGVPVTSGKYFVQKSFGINIENDNPKLVNGKALNRDTWATLYLSGVAFKNENRNVDEPDVFYRGSEYEELKNIKQEFDWREILIEYLLYGGN